MLVPGSWPISCAETTSSIELEFFWMTIAFCRLLTKPLITTGCSRFSLATCPLVVASAAAVSLWPGVGDYVVHHSRLQPLLERGAHLVRWGPVISEQPGLSIGCDNAFGGRLAAEHLLAIGRRRIAFLGEIAPSSPEMAARYRGYRAALADAGVEADPRLQISAISTEASGYEALQALCGRRVPFDAVFGASDLIAIGAMTALASAGHRVPHDVSVVGFDGIPMGAFTRPALTTVAQDTKRAGELLVQTLIHLIDGRPAECVTLPPRLIVRGSSDVPAPGAARRADEEYLP